MEKTIHQGRNIKRFREMLGIKQDVLAIDLGLSQQAISALEQKETLDHDMLEKIAGVLKVPSEAIKKFDEEAAFNIISNTFTSNDGSTPSGAGLPTCCQSSLNQQRFFDTKIFDPSGAFFQPAGRHCIPAASQMSGRAVTRNREQVFKEKNKYTGLKLPVC